MSDAGGSARRYCSVCGYLSSEPAATCPHCTLSSARVPQVVPTPMLYPRASHPESESRGPPAWAVIAAILVIALIAILAILTWDGVFSSPSSTGSVVVEVVRTAALRATPP